MQADFKVKTLSFFYFPFQKFPLVSFLKSPMNYLPLSFKKLPLPDFVKSLFSLEFFPTSHFVYPSWWYCFRNPCYNVPSHSKNFTPLPTSLFPHKLIAKFDAVIPKACSWNTKGWKIIFSYIMRQKNLSPATKLCSIRFFCFGKSPWCKMRSASTMQCKQV